MLDSIKDQSYPPDGVLVCLPKWSAREKCTYKVPEWLLAYQPLVQVVECAEDYGPGTKLLGCLEYLPRECCLIIADDDMVYKPFFLEGLYRNTILNQQCSFSYWTYSAPPFTVAQGADGFSFMSRNLQGIQAFAAQAIRNPHLRVVDDLWISAFLMQKGIEVRSLKHEIPHQGSVYDIAHDVNQLHDLEGNLERGIAMTQGVRYLLESGLMGRRRQVVALMKKNSGAFSVETFSHCTPHDKGQFMLSQIFEQFIIPSLRP